MSKAERESGGTCTSLIPILMDIYQIFVLYMYIYIYIYIKTTFIMTKLYYTLVKLLIKLFNIFEFDLKM